jgi:hypothetical protein
VLLARWCLLLSADVVAPRGGRRPSGSADAKQQGHEYNRHLERDNHPGWKWKLDSVGSLATLTCPVLAPAASVTCFQKAHASRYG